MLDRRGAMLQRGGRAFCSAGFRTACFTDRLSWGETRQRKPLFFKDFRPLPFS
jgi:hypothetical protein